VNNLLAANINLDLNTYELNDNPMTFFYPPPTMEGEYMNVETVNFINKRFNTKQKTVYQAIFAISSIQIEHKRDAFDFLLFLANIGGV
jgi:hypothetical protein